MSRLFLRCKVDTNVTVGVRGTFTVFKYSVPRSVKIRSIGGSCASKTLGTVEPYHSAEPCGAWCFRFVELGKGDFTRRFV